VTSVADAERALVRLCCDTKTPQLESIGLDEEHAKIWGIYRHMVRSRFLEEGRASLRRTLKAVGDDAFEATFERFLADAPPRSRAFFGVVPELAAFAADHWRGNADMPAWAADLVAYEGARVRVADLPSRRDRSVAEFEFDRVPELHDAMLLLSLSHRVHRDPEPDGSYERRPTEICVYRAKDERTVGAYVLGSFAAACMRAWQEGATVGDSVARVCEARQIEANAKLIDGLCTVLSDLMERGVVLGSRP